MDIDFYFENLCFFSVELYWKDKNTDKNSINIYEYELYQKEGNDNFITNYFLFKKIYKGNNTSFKVTKLNPNETYTFKLNVLKGEEIINEKKITITTLYHSSALISENSIKIAKGEIIKYNNQLTKSNEKIIKNCSKLIFSKNDGIAINGDFDGIDIKITHDDKNNIYYISFDIKSSYLEEFFNTYIDESKNDLIIPCHFILEKLPNILIFNLLEKGAVIFTGKRLGGIIASSLAFYILFLGRLTNKNNNYNNVFKEVQKNSIGVVTFGSPSFLYNLNIGYEMIEFVSYFINIKEEFDYIPALIDYINFGRFIDEDSIVDNFREIFNKNNYCYNKTFLNIFQKIELDNKEKNYLNQFSKQIHFKEENLKVNIEKFKSIPFGHYYMIKNSEFCQKLEYDFYEFYYFKINSNECLSNLNEYKKIKSDESIFNKSCLEYLEKKDYQLELIKILRRENKDKTIKGIIKFKLKDIDDYIISPDLINKIELQLIKEKKEINNKNIFYDNDTDVIAYIDNLNEKINDINIYNYFGGKIKVKHIINIQGSGQTRKMLRENIEKLFLIPFFKLFEIFYDSFNDKQKYEKLKKENFGENFQDLKILEPFKMQIKIFDDLLLFSRPDILGKFEKEFMEDLSKNLTKKQIYYFSCKLRDYYKQAKVVQTIQNINCLDSQSNSLAKKNSFPQEIIGDTKKLFMCIPKDFELENILSKESYDKSFIKKFLIENLISEILRMIEDNIKRNINEKDFKNYLNNEIGNLYDEFIVPNCYFVKIIILSSIESGDYIKFNHKIDKDILIQLLHNFCVNQNDIYGSLKMLFYHFKIIFCTEKDFKKNYTKKKIEEMKIKNFFYKKKVKNIIRSNISQNNFILKNINALSEYLFKKNTISNFSQYSEKEISGEQYYLNFLEILNNYSNDFQEDIEISIYDYLREEIDNRKQNILTIKEMINDLIDDIESKKGFSALIRQSYLLGKVRSYIVSKFN